MNYVNEQNMQEILDGIALKIGTGGGSGAGLEDWQASHEYKEKDICVYEGQIYRAKVGYTSDTNFSTTQILEEYTPIGGETIIPYEKDTEINTDDIVSYDNNTYKALYDFMCGEEFSLYALQEYVPIELTDDDIKEIVNSYNPIFEEAKGIEYSTEERRIGTWIDGKPLYQKTIVDTMPIVTTDKVQESKYIEVGVSVDTPVWYEIIRMASNNSIVIIPTPPDTDGYYTKAYFYSNSAPSVSNMVGLFSNALSFSGQTVYITIKYTKTTD